MKTRPRLVLSHVLASAAAVFALTAVVPACAQDQAGGTERTSAPERPSVSVPRADARALPDFSALVEQYGDAVVNVESTRQLDLAGSPSGPMSPDDPFFEFFRRFGIPMPDGPGGPGGGPAPSPRLQRGEGSGFVVSADGYILTNAHVVAEATDVTVKLTDRREFPAKVIGTDPRSDVAVLKIEARDLPVVKIGNSRDLRPGDWVLAIGAPFGLENSVTVGVVSATSRAVGMESSIVPFIQTDVAVNPGNSGGPLFNLDGEVVGINSMIYSGTGGYQGVSFAIPIDMALDVQQQLVKTGRVTRGRIGVTIQEVNAQLAQSFGLERPRGALVSSVEKDGPAARAGIRPGDIIVGVGEQQIEVSTELPGIVAKMRPGSRAEFDVIRGGQEREIEVRIGELEEPRSTIAARAGGDTADAPQLGVNVRPLTPAEQQQAETQGGLLVEQVTGPAARAGLQQGDIILRVGDSPVASVDDLRKALEKSSTVALLIQREDAQIYVPVRLG